jgi:hypothetical protein
MQIVENWSDVDVEIKGISANTSDPNYVLVKAKVYAAAPVRSFPNLLANHIGEEIEIRVPKDHASMASGDRIRLRVRQAGLNHFFAHPDPIDQ